MSTRCAVLLCLILSAGPSTLAGCRTPAPQAPATDDSAQAGLAPATGRDGGLLLRTGAIQLGPGVQRNQWGWQGDGKGGF